MNELILVGLRSIVVYLFIVIAIRIFGKKELSQLSVVDLVFILLISNSVQNAMVGNNSSLSGGLAAATALFVVNFVLKDIFFKSKKISEFFQGDPVTLIYRGKLFKENLNKTGFTMDELMEAIREHGVEKVKDVDLAILEIDGNISVLSHNFKRKTSRKRRAHKGITKNV